MLFAVETEMNPVGINGDEFMRRLPEGVDYLKKLQRQGTLVHAWIRVGGGGGLSIFEVSSHEELLGALYQNPIAPHLKFKVTPLAPVTDFKGTFEG
jgi:muconolactone delta-isomerase